MQSARDDVPMRGKTVRQRIVHPTLVDVADSHGRAPRLLRHSSGQQADGASAEDQCSRAWCRAAAVDRVDGYRKGLEERGGGEAYVVGQSC
jgi:hypothetical protein